MPALINILYCFASFLLATDPAIEKAKADFAKVNQTYKSEKFSVQMVYNYYYEHKSITPDESKTGVYYKNGGDSYSNLMGIESIRNKNLSLVIQNDEKIMVVSNPVKAGSVMATNIDTLLRLCSRVSLTDLPSGQVKYELFLDPKKGTGYQQMDVYINKKTYTVDKLIMYYDQQEIQKEDKPDETRIIHPKMEIIYRNFNAAYVVDPVMFSEKNYVVMTSPNKYKGIAKYAQYKVYNQKFK